MQTKRRAPEEVAITDGRKIARELFGLFLIFWGLLVLLSLVSFDQNDPSINHAVSNPAIVKNLRRALRRIPQRASGRHLRVRRACLAPRLPCVGGGLRLHMVHHAVVALVRLYPSGGLPHFPSVRLGTSASATSGGGGMLGMTLYTKFTTLFSPVGSSLIWLSCCSSPLRWPSASRGSRLSRKGWALLKEQLSGTPLSLDDLPERLSKVSMPRSPCPNRVAPKRDKKMRRRSLQRHPAVRDP